MRGVITQVSAPKSNNACTTSLKKNPDTRGSTPSLLRVLINLLHTSLALDKFLTTAGQSSFASDITRPRYQKEVAISKGRP